VIYMPGRDLGAVAAQLRSEGLPAELPCVIVSRAAQPDQQILRTTLARLDRAVPGPAPSILLVGEALREADAADMKDVASLAADDRRERPAIAEAQ
jgi:siroheme synthase